MPDETDPKRPTIDERLEAVNQTLELVASMQLDNEKRFEDVAMMQRDNEERWNKRFAEIAESIGALARIAEIHEHRITGLEDQQQ